MGEKDFKSKLEKFFPFFVFLILLFSLTTIGFDAAKQPENPKMNQVVEYIWFDPVLLSQNQEYDDFNPSLASDDEGNLYAVWTARESLYGDYNITYRFYNASKKQWTPVYKVTSGFSDDADFSRIAVDTHGNVHIVYQRDASSYVIEHVMMFSNNNSWTEPYRLSLSFYGALRPAIVADSSGNIHVAWEEKTSSGDSGSDRDIFFKTWNQSTNSWSDFKLVSKDSDDYSMNVDIASYKDMLFFVWEDESPMNDSGSDTDIYFRSYNLTSNVWGNVELVSANCDGNSRYPSITVSSDGVIHVAWVDYSSINNSGTDADIFYREKPLTGTWSDIVVVSSESTSDSSADHKPGMIATPSNDVVISWSDKTNINGAGTDEDIFIKTLSHEKQWSPLQLITKTSNTANSPALTYANNKLFLIYSEEKSYSNMEIYMVNGTVAKPPQAPILNDIKPNTNYNGIVNLTWTAVPTADKYNVYRSTQLITTKSTATLIGSTSTTNYTDHITSNGTYYYVVTALNETGESGISNCVNVTVILNATTTTSTTSTTSTSSTTSNSTTTLTSENTESTETTPNATNKGFLEFNPQFTITTLLVLGILFKRKTRK